jgi:hypothetical protein
LEYPLAFQDAFIQVLESRAGKSPFRYVHVSGKLVEQDQSKSLWFLNAPRKNKVLCPSQSFRALILLRGRQKHVQSSLQTITVMFGKATSFDQVVCFRKNLMLPDYTECWERIGSSVMMSWAPSWRNWQSTVERRTQLSPIPRYWRTGKSY